MANQNKYEVYKKQDTRKFKPEIAILVLVLAAVISFGGFVVMDQLNNPDQINNEKNSATLGFYDANIDAFKEIDNDLYTISIPEGWVEVNSPELINDGSRYYPARYQGVTGEDVGRWLDIYIDNIPDLPVDRVAKVTASGNKISFVESSPLCTTLPVNKDKERTAFQPTEWEDISFVCRMSSIGNTLAATDAVDDDGVNLTGKENGTHDLLFVFGDHGSDQDNKIFEKIINSFILK